MKYRIRFVMSIVGLMMLSGCQGDERPQVLPPAGFDDLIKQSEILKKEPTNQKQSTAPYEQSEDKRNLIEGLEALKILYGEQTVPRDPNDPWSLHGPALGTGKLLNQEINKPLDTWKFIDTGTKAEPNQQEYSLIMDETCFIHAIGFMNASCRKYFSLEEHKNINYDGENGPEIAVYGKILPDTSIHVSDLIIQQ